MRSPLAGLPILSCEEALRHETAVFARDEAREWSAIQRAGDLLAAAIWQDFLEVGDWPAVPRLLVIAGKGHNGADALVATAALLKKLSGATARVVVVPGTRSLRPLSQRALRSLTAAQGERVHIEGLQEFLASSRSADADLLIDGLFGMQFREPMEADCAALAEMLNAGHLRMRASVDLPSGLATGSTLHERVVRADFTYATGSVKSPLLRPECRETVGRIRALDLGLFQAAPKGAEGTFSHHDQVASPACIAPLQGLRRAGLGKVSAGHVLIIAGSHRYPGTAMLATLGALHAGAGLVTTCLPESLHASFAARAPEAMWTALPQTEEGGLALESLSLILPHLSKAHAVVIGPGLGRETETTALLAELVRRTQVPLLLDADALMPSVVERLAGRKHSCVLTPHAGEWKRIASSVFNVCGVGSPNLADPQLATENYGPSLSILLKGNPSCLFHHGGPRLYLPHGGEVLARGGHGDLLAGLLGALLADPTFAAAPERAVAAGVTWAGLAAERLARSRGQRAAPTTALLDHLAAVLRELA